MYAIFSSNRSFRFPVPNSDQREMQILSTLSMPNWKIYDMRDGSQIALFPFCLRCVLIWGSSVEKLEKPSGKKLFKH
jgi:hypothetical protein